MSKAPLKKEAKKVKPQAKTMPAGPIRQQSISSPPAQLLQQRQVQQQVIQQQQQSTPPNELTDQAVEVQNLSPAIDVGNDDALATELEELDEQQFGEQKVAKIPSWANKQANKALDYTEQQVQKVKKVFSKQPAEKVARRVVSEKSIDLSTLSKSEPSQLFDSPSQYMSYFSVGANEVLNEVIMKEMRQIADIQLYWMRFSTKTFKSLTSLDVSFCPNVSELGVRFIATYLPALKQLDVTGCRVLTEASLRVVISKCEHLKNAKFDMTSVRYLPPHPAGVTISTKNCPILLDEATVAKAKPPLPNDLLKFSTAKIVVIKPVEMRDTFIAHEFAKPDDEVLGLPSFICSYRSGTYRVIECTEDIGVQLLLSENCNIVLPYFGNNNSSEGILKEARSVEARFNLVFSLIKNANVIAVAVSVAAGDTKIVDALRNEIRSMIKEVEPSDDTKYPTDQRLAMMRYLLEHDLHFAASPSGVLQRIVKYSPHLDIPKSFFLLLQALEKSNLLTQKELPFFTVDHLVQTIGKTVPADFQPSWPAFVSLLAETGNCWAESITGDYGPMLGPKHILASSASFLNFFMDFNSAADSTAAAEDIPCLPCDTPLCTVEHVKKMICPNPKALSEDDFFRLMNLFELTGIAIFRRRSALAWAVVRNEPPIKTDHFLESEWLGSSSVKLKKKMAPSSDAPPPSSTASIQIDYPVLCRPSSLFTSLVSLMVKLVPPTLLWRNGAFFYEVSFLEILVTVDDEARTVSLRFSGEKFAFDNIADTSLTQGVGRLKFALRGSCSAFHTACCLVLKPYTNVDLNTLGLAYGIKMLRPCTISHNVAMLPMRSSETFSRQLDTTMARCSCCLFDVNTISMMRRFFLRDPANIVGPAVLRPTAAMQYKTVGTMLLCDWSTSAELGCCGFQPVFADIVSTDGIQSITIHPGNRISTSKERITLLFNDTGKLVDYFQGPPTNNNKSVKDSKKSEKHSGKATYSIVSGVRIEARIASNNALIVTICVNGQIVFEATITENCSFATIETESKAGTAASSKLSESAIYAYAPDKSLLVSRVMPGMSLEAIDLKYPSLVAVAFVKEIDADGKWKIAFDDWGETYDYWAEPTSENLFPCGFMNYICQDDELFNRFQTGRGIAMTRICQKPQGSDWPEKPFPWPEYFKHLREQNPTAVASPVPMHYFEENHLLGFTNPENSVVFRPDMKTLTNYCISARPSVLLNNTSSYLGGSDKSIFRSPRFIPLPPVNWSLICWPSRIKMTNPTITRPHFLCCWPDFVHFINESTDTMSVPRCSINATPPLSLALTLMKLLSQPHFIPEQYDQIFADLLLDCPYSFSNMSIKTSGAASKAAHIEHCLRQYLIPFLLDYLTVCSCYAEQSPNGHDQGVTFPLAIDDSSLIDGATNTVDLYLRRLHADGSSQSRWPAVTITPDKPKPKCLLLNMQEAESELYNRDYFCPKLICGQHAYHYKSYTKANDTDDINWESSLHSFNHQHDKFLTMCAYNADDIKELQKPLNDIHPFMTEFIGFLSTNFDKAAIFSMTWLSELTLFKNQLSDLPNDFAKLAPTLKRLDLSYNNFTGIPKVVCQLTALEVLRVDNVPLKSLDEQIGNLKNLKSLSLQYNCLPTLPASFKSLNKLEVLDLSGLPSLPSMSSSLYLEEVVSFFEKNNFPKEEATAALAKWVETEGNNALDRAAIKRLSEHLFATLPRLKLDKGAFPIDCSLHEALQELIISNQPMTIVPGVIGKLNKLAHLDLSGCLLLEEIKPEISSCPLEVLNLNNCPVLRTPPLEIRKRGFIATLAYFRRLAQGSVTCKRTKLMFVGLGGAGKTSLVNSLMTEVQPNSKFEVTDGIDIHNWTVDCKDGTSVDFRMWDFAGQVVYYNTHQFFLSSRAVYLLLWNIRLGHEHAGLDFWLSSIACHAPNAPILIVGTHVDEVSQERSFLSETSYRERFSSVCGFHYVSSFSGQGIEKLRADILKVALAQKHMGELIPVAWLNFESKLLHPEERVEKIVATTEAQDESVLTLDFVSKIASTCGVYSADEIDQALQFLSDLGTIQFFKTDFLRDRVIINPQWIVDVMACVVSVKHLLIKDGHLPHSDIPKLWAQYPTELHPWLLKLTEAFDLTFPLKKEPVSVVPCLLPEDAPDSLIWPSLDDNPGHRQSKLIFSFKYLPSGLFNRVQVRLCQFSDGAKIWRRGSLLQKNQHIALLTQPDATSIQVKVQGPCPDNITFLILEVIDTLIVEAFQGVQPDYLFACPACVSARASDPSMFERSRIRRAYELRIPFLQCWNYFHSVSTQELRQLFPAESSSEFDSQFSRTVQEISNIRQSLKIDVLVIGCSTDADPADAKNVVSTPEVGANIQKSFPQLSVIVVANPDSASDAGSFDQLSIMMRSARLIVFCLSDKFMASDRCQAAFFTGKESLKKPVLMLLIRDFDYHKIPALAFQMNDDIFVKAFPRSRYRAPDVAARIQSRLSQLSSISELSAVQKTYPDVFLSYCWVNSRDAIEKGTKATSKSLGVTDPRLLKKFLADKELSVWLDIEQIGLGGLFRDIADGIRNSQVVVVCVSDEYVKSENCLREFHFASTSCHRPIVLCAVGTGADWQLSEVNLIVNQSATFINFQVDLKENYDSLYNAINSLVKKREDPNAAKTAADPSMTTTLPLTSKRVPLGNIGPVKTMLDIQVVPDQSADDRSDARQSSLVLHEMIELGQRKFLRQLVSLSEAAGTRSYPRLVVVDVVSSSTPIATKIESDAAAENGAESARGKPEGDDVFSKLQWCVRFLCESESGWHATDVTLAILDSTNPSQIIRQSIDYFGQILSFIRHSNVATLEMLAPKNEQISEACREAVNEIDKTVDSDQNFGDDYCKFKDFVISLDQYACTGGLNKCQLAIGKELWLCAEHQKTSDYRLAANGNATVPESSTAANENAEGGDHDANAENATRLRVHRPIAKTASDSAFNRNEQSEQPALATSLQVTGEPTRQASSSNLTSLTNRMTTSRACSIQ